jgi:hypothetical protein
LGNVGSMDPVPLIGTILETKPKWLTVRNPAAPYAAIQIGRMVKQIPTSIAIVAGFGLPLRFSRVLRMRKIGKSAMVIGIAMISKMVIRFFFTGIINYNKCIIYYSSFRVHNSLESIQVS